MLGTLDDSVEVCEAKRDARDAAIDRSQRRTWLIVAAVLCGVLLIVMIGG